MVIYDGLDGFWIKYPAVQTAVAQQQSLNERAKLAAEPKSQALIWLKSLYAEFGEHSHAEFRNRSSQRTCADECPSVDINDVEKLRPMAAQDVSLNRIVH